MSENKNNNEDDLPRYLPDRIIVRKSQISPGMLEDETDLIIELPRVYISQFTLEFLGFTPEASAHLWTQWKDMPVDSQDRVAFEKYILDDIKVKSRTINAGSLLEDYGAALRAYGFKEDTIEGIVDPEFEDVRLTQSASRWALEGVRDNFEWLDLVLSKRYGWGRGLLADA